MTKARKITVARIAIAIKAMPLVNYALNASRKLIFRRALYLYRKNKFLSLAALQQFWLFTVTTLFFSFSVYTNSNAPSLLVQIGYPFNAFIAVMYPVMNAYYGAKTYAIRKELFVLRLKRKAKLKMLTNRLFK